MASAVSLRGDYSAAQLRRLAAATKNVNQSQPEQRAENPAWFIPGGGRRL